MGAAAGNTGATPFAHAGGHHRNPVLIQGHRVIGTDLDADAAAGAFGRSHHRSNTFGRYRVISQNNGSPAAAALAWAMASSIGLG